MITAVNNVSFKNNYYMNFEGSKKQKSQYEPRHSSSALKAIPLATLIAMSPLNAPSATYDFDQNPEKIIMMHKMENGPEKATIRFVDVDGDISSAEKITLEFSQTIHTYLSDKNSPSGRVPVKYSKINLVNLDSLKQVNVTTTYESGGDYNSTEYYVIGDTKFLTSQMKATDGSNRVIRSARQQQEENYSYKISKEIYDYLIDISSDGLPRKTEVRRDYISLDEESEILGL